MMRSFFLAALGCVLGAAVPAAPAPTFLEPFGSIFQARTSLDPGAGFSW
jgi:hypothetical protein